MSLTQRSRYASTQGWMIQSVPDWCFVGGSAVENERAGMVEDWKGGSGGLIGGGWERMLVDRKLHGAERGAYRTVNFETGGRVMQPIQG